jgi:hypothetical protein
MDESISIADFFPPKIEESISIAIASRQNQRSRFLLPNTSLPNWRVDFYLQFLPAKMKMSSIRSIAIYRDGRWTMAAYLRSPPQTPTPTTPTTYHGPEP